MNEIQKIIEDKDIVSLAQALCLPFKNGKGKKEKLILDILASFNKESSYIKDVGIRVKSKEKTSKVIVSHIDLIPLFNKGFKKQETIVIEEKDGSKIVKGALDNTITNAVSILGLIHSKSEDVEFLFTEGEEIGLIGMKKYMEKFHDKDVFYINLDVTNDNWDFHSSLEYDNPCYSIVSQLAQTKECEIGFTSFRECDDMDAILNNGGYGFSYCIPTQKGIHSYRNYTLYEKLEPYLNGLLFIIDHLNVEEKKKDIFIKNLHDVSKMTNEEFLKENKKRETSLSNYPSFHYDSDEDEELSDYNSSFMNMNLGSSNYNEMDHEYISSILSILEYEANISFSKNENKDFYYLLFNSLVLQKSFQYDDLLNALSNDPFENMEYTCDDVLAALLDNDFIVITGPSNLTKKKSTFMVRHYY